MSSMGSDPPVHVLSCLGAARDLDLLGHFLRHYQQLGVRLDRFHFIVHADTDDSEALVDAVELLGELGLEPAEVWRGVYTSDAMWQRRRAMQRMGVGAEEWVLSADIDELHVYPAPLADVLQELNANGHNVLQGPMIDRVASDGRLAPVERQRPLPEQFPVVADVMCPIGGIRPGPAADGTVKMMLFRGDVIPGIGGHAPWKAQHGPWRREGVSYAAGRPLADFPEVVDADWRFEQPAAVHHYKWTQGLAGAVRRRRAAPGASARGSAYGTAVLDYLERNGGRIRLEDVAVAEDARRPRLLRRLVGRSTTSAPATDHWEGRLRRLRERPRPPLRATPRRRPLSEESPHVADGWRLRRLTDGTPEGTFHAHSYYDIPVLDDSRSFVAAHRMRIEDRWMTPEDPVTVGVVDVAEGGFRPIAETTAWSWQQGPLAQWVPGTGKLVWNHRDGDQFVARLHDLDTGKTRTLPRSVYAIAPDGATALGLDMARLSRARPGYGYFGGDPRGAEVAAPTDDGVWRIGVADGVSELVLPLAEAVAFLHSALPAPERAELVSTPHLYWLNHAKFSPDGRRFTVKLRWRLASLEEPWRGTQSASLTANVDGTDVHLLCRAASHVMWRSGHELVCWDERRGRLAVLRDRSPHGELLRDLPEHVFEQNVHLHPLAGSQYLYDVPYGETVQLRWFDEAASRDELLAEFGQHLPPHGPFRCDLHPVPTSDGRLTVVTSLHDGGRQVYLLEREG